MLKKLFFRFRRLMRRQTSPDMFFAMLRRLPLRGWRIQEVPVWPYGGIRLCSPDSTDTHLYCPIEAVAREFTGYPWRRSFTVTAYVPGRAIGLSEDFIRKVSNVSDSPGPFFNEDERETHQQILKVFSRA